jgi:hypothetical protein
MRSVPADYRMRGARAGITQIDPESVEKNRRWLIVRGCRGRSTQRAWARNEIDARSPLAGGRGITESISHQASRGAVRRGRGFRPTMIQKQHQKTASRP